MTVFLKVPIAIGLELDSACMCETECEENPDSAVS